MSDPSPPSGTTGDGEGPPTSFPWAGFLDAPEVRRVSAPANDQLVATVLVELDDLDRRLARDRTSSSTPRPPRPPAPGSRASATRATPGRASSTSSWSPGHPRHDARGGGHELRGRGALVEPRGPRRARAAVAGRSARREVRRALGARQLRPESTARPGSRPDWSPRRPGRHDAASRDSRLPRSARSRRAPPSAAPSCADAELLALVDPPTDALPSDRCLCSDRAGTLALAVRRASASGWCSPLRWRRPTASLADGSSVAVHLGVHRAPASRAPATSRSTGASRQLWSAIDAQPHEWVLVARRRRRRRGGAPRRGSTAPRPAASSSPAGAATPRHGVPGAHVVEVEALGPESGARLLLDRADRAGGGVSRTARHQARRVSELLAGTPLALLQRRDAGGDARGPPAAPRRQVVDERLRTSRQRSTRRRRCARVRATACHGVRPATSAGPGR